MKTVAPIEKARLAPLEPPYPSEVAETLMAMMPPGVPPLRLFRTLAHNPRVLGKIRASNLLDRGSLERRDRELAILRTCARCGSEYEWGVHVSIFARRFGIPDEKIAGTADWSADDPRWDERERAIVGMVDQLHDRAHVDDASWRSLQQQFRSDQLVELVVLVGFYHTISFVTNGFGIALEADAERFPSARATAGS